MVRWERIHKSNDSALSLEQGFIAGNLYSRRSHIDTRRSHIDIGVYMVYWVEKNRAWYEKQFKGGFLNLMSDGRIWKSK